MSVLATNLVILAVVLTADLGHRRVTVTRLARPVVAAAIIVPFFLATGSASGSGLVLESTGAVVGLIVGVGAAALIVVRRSSDGGRVTSWAGVGYAMVWIVVTTARLGFTYGASHLFGIQLAGWMLANRVSVGALTDALILFSITMLVGRTALLAIKAHRAAGHIQIQPPSGSPENLPRPEACHTTRRCGHPARKEARP